MDTERGLQEVVSRNVRVLMAVHDITHQKDLAARLGWDAPKLARSLSGQRRWALEDLPVVADAFGVRPAALLSDTAELVGASPPAAAVSGITRRVTGEYRASNDALVIQFPLARRPHTRYLTQSAHVSTLPMASQPEQSKPLSDESSGTATTVTAVVGS